MHTCGCFLAVQAQDWRVRSQGTSLISESLRVRVAEDQKQGQVDPVRYSGSSENTPLPRHPEVQWSTVKEHSASW